MASDSTSSIAGTTTHRPRCDTTHPQPRHAAPPAPSLARCGPPAPHTLDSVVKAVSQTDGIGLIDVEAFATLVVRTDNSVYRITILRPHAREVLVQGGKFFPERTRACLSGSTFGGSCLKIDWVGLGLHLEFHAGDQCIITSHVCAIAIEPPATGAQC